LIIAAVFGGLVWFLLALLIPFSGYFVLFYQEIFRERLNTLRYSLKSILNPDLIKDLKSQRVAILETLDRVKLT
jgi:hypothetical protein